jgi:hypothetical protein
LLQYLSLHNVIKVLPGNIHAYSLLLGQEDSLNLGVMDMISKLRIHFCKFLSNLPRIPCKLLVALLSLEDFGTFLRFLVLLTFAVALIAARVIVSCVLLLTISRITISFLSYSVSNPMFLDEVQD